VGGLFQERGRSLEEQRGRAAALNDLGQAIRRRHAPRSQNGFRPRLRKRLEHPEPEVVRESDTGQPVPLGQVIEGHEVEE
jgi:hypothetical protein